MRSRDFCAFRLIVFESVNISEKRSGFIKFVHFVGYESGIMKDKRALDELILPCCCFDTMISVLHQIIFVLFSFFFFFPLDAFTRWASGALDPESTVSGDLVTSVKR